MIFLLALWMPWISYSKPLLRHINTSVDNYYEFLEKNPGAEDFISWQKEQITTQLMEPSEMDLCLFNMGKARSLNNHCKKTFEELLQTPLNQNSLDQLIFLFEQLEKNQVNPKQYSALFMGLTAKAPDHPPTVDQLKLQMQKIKTVRGRENCELMINGNSWNQSKNDPKKRVALTKNSNYQFALLCDSTQPLIFVGSVDGFIHYLQKQTTMTDPFGSCKNKEVDFYLNEFSVLFADDCVMNYPIRASSFPIKSFSEIKSEGMDWKWIALLGAIAVGTQLQGRSYMISF